MLHTGHASGSLAGVIRALALLASVAIVGSSLTAPEVACAEDHTVTAATVDLDEGQPTSRPIVIAAAAVRRITYRPIDSAEFAASHGPGFLSSGEPSPPITKWRRLARMALEGDGDH